MSKQANTIVIKRYQNRKLYDTKNSTYVTLDDIAKLVRDGEDVQVIDNKTKDDLTDVTLTQIIFEEGKKKKSVLPLHTLKGIIKYGGDTFSFIEKKIDEGVSGITNISSKAKVWPEKVMDKIKDEIEEDSRKIKEVLHKTQDFSKKIDEKIKTTVQSVTPNVGSSADVKALNKRIAELEKKLREYQ